MSPKQEHEASSIYLEYNVHFGAYKIHRTAITTVRINVSYKVKVSFQTGLRFALTVFVFCFAFPDSDGISFNLTYGSAKPFGSIGFKFFASRTVIYQNKNKKLLLKMHMPGK